MPRKIVFMGTPAFAVPALQGLINSHHTVVAVYSQPPRPAGRGQKLTPSPVHQLAEQYDIPVFTPENFKSAESIKTLRSHDADLAVVAAYGLLLPRAVLESFPESCINIHPSALPRWRGAAPLHRTVLAGDKTTELCIMQMDEGLDTGHVLLRKHYELPGDITTGQLHDWLSAEAAPLLLEALDKHTIWEALSTPQSDEGVTYAKKIMKEEARINWKEPAGLIDRQIRGLNPFPGAHFTLNGEPIKILSASLALGQFEPGVTLDDLLTIGTGNGSLRPVLVQRPGKKIMPVEEMLKGFPIPAGTVLE